MKLYTSAQAPNPRRVHMFLAEKGQSLPEVMMDLNALDHQSASYRSKNPLARVPALELDDGRVLSETRAICTYLESLWPEPNLMGRTGEERAFIEMADRRMEWYWLLPVAQCVRHTHPGLAVLEQPQFADFGKSQGEKAMTMAHWLDDLLKTQTWVAGERFSIADITAFCALEFARLMRFKPQPAGLRALARWRDEMMLRASASV
jgi:glutathione S-transferase